MDGRHLDVGSEQPREDRKVLSTSSNFQLIPVDATLLSTRTQDTIDFHRLCD